MWKLTVWLCQDASFVKLLFLLWTEGGGKCFQNNYLWRIQKCHCEDFYLTFEITTHSCNLSSVFSPKHFITFLRTLLTFFSVKSNFMWKQLAETLDLVYPRKRKAKNICWFPTELSMINKIIFLPSIGLLCIEGLEHLKEKCNAINLASVWCIQREGFLKENNS